MSFIRHLVLLLCFPLILQAQKARTYNAVTEELANKVVTAPLPATPMRLAVVPFSATASSTQASSQFGEYLTETIIGLLGNHPDKVKLFERTRLDAILKEHEFILTDLMKPAAALKIGQLAPIDALLSGTYTKLKSYTDVSARLIDVASGEVLLSYNGRIKMNKNLAALFPAAGTVVAIPPSSVTPKDSPTPSPTTPAAVSTPSEEERCKQKVSEYQLMLRDLSTKEKIDAAALEAMKTPFDNRCGQLHYHLMYAFTRYSIDHPAYQQFLLQTLDSIRYPAGDERAYEIVRFITTDKKLDNAEWKASLNAISRVGNYSLSNYLNYLLAKPDTETDLSYARIAEYFSLAIAGKIGLPRPLSYEACFFEMMEGLRSNTLLSRHVYKTYSARLRLDEKSMPTVFSELRSLYKSEKENTHKTEILEWLCDFINTHEYPKAHEQLYDFAWEYNLTHNESRNEEIRREFPPADLSLLANRCSKKFAAYVTLTPYSSQQEDRINFCVRNGILVPGIVPTLDEAQQILAGNNLDDQLRVMKLLVQMNNRPAHIESTLVSLFDRRSLEDRGKMDQVQTLAITVLGNCKTANQKAIGHMINVLPHYGNDTEAAKVALVQIGKPAVAPLAARLDKTTDQDGGLQYQLITLLGEIGADAAPAEKSIRRVLGITRNSDVKYAAEAALQAIGKQP
ncbi:MAG: hypothetical protein JNN04_15995 [Cyclobacteriaceae bacterium]|nr:hypothetical protein [Cyclobacteriaceae bacterium]